MIPKGRSFVGNFGSLPQILPRALLVAVVLVINHSIWRTVLDEHRGNTDDCRLTFAQDFIKGRIEKTEKIVR